jgi:predicted nucleic acid-binding protein
VKAYADTGFVVSLYKMESTSEKAAALMRKLESPVWISALSEIELRNAFQLSVFRGEIDKASAELKLRLFQQDLKKGIYAVMPVSSSALHSKTAELIDRHSARIGTRSLDLMHIATAILLNADLFLSFDLRQRKAAKLEGLKVKP